MRGSTSPRKVAEVGLSLIETVVVVLIFALLATTITSLLIGGLRIWTRGQTMQKLRADARTAMDQIAADFHDATSAAPTLIPINATQGYQVIFHRTENVSGVATTAQITYTFDDTTHELTRQDSANSTTPETIVASNTVYQDSTGTVKSYFEFPNGSSDTSTLRVVIFLADDASTGHADSHRISMTLRSDIQAVADVVGATVSPTPIPTPMVDLVTPLSVPSALERPERLPFRRRLPGGR